MNICMLTPVYLPYVGGTQLAIQSLAHELTMRGHQVTIVTLTPGREIPQNVEERVVRLSFSRARRTQFLSYNAVCFRRVLEEEMRQPFDQLHLFHVFPLGIASLFLKKVLHLPLMTTLMGSDTYSPQPEMLPGQSIRFAGAFVSLIMNSSDLVTSPSTDLAHHARLQGCKKDITVIPHGVNPDRFEPSALRKKALDVRRRLGIGTSGRMILTVHRLDKRKDLVTAILALRNVLRHKPGVKLVVVGQGPEYERFLGVARKNGMASSVVFVGSLTDAELPSYYVAADLFLLSSFYEAFGLVLVEAMAAGKCVVASNVGGVPEIVRNQITGFLFPVGDVDMLASILLKALEDEKLRVEMGRLGRKRVLDHYSWAEIARRYSNAYTSLSTQLCRAGPD